MQTLKRYLIAFSFLLLVIVMMLGATMGVESFGETLAKKGNIEMQPRGEHIQ